MSTTSTTNYKIPTPEMTDTVGVTIPALKTAFTTIDTQIKSMANTALLSGNGYFQDKTTGFIIEWGNLTVNSGGGSRVTFPLAFPVAVLQIVTSQQDGGGNVINTISKAGFNIGMAGKSSWFAIGH